MQGIKCCRASSVAEHQVLQSRYTSPSMVSLCLLTHAHGDPGDMEVHDARSMHYRASSVAEQVRAPVHMGSLCLSSQQC